ncbi:dienelactone hydrolase family protein [Undibacterium terreum]|uniref:Carboxymethylenebutenolidase n=1 Tax=Undibacterium terreum TaxID=1224302 RepID=A0A916UCU9_9BURK|nr:dienelactone hydrolase family protein [Undibacterium terreum]GGC66370.1 carboxymethylenebutenolidase [Undibacterium terreum]
METDLKIHTPDGSFSTYVAYPKSLPAPAVIILQEIFGVNPDMRQTADELAAEGFIAICPDLFWRQIPEVQLSDKTDWETGLKLYQAYDLTEGVADIVSTMHAARAMKNGTGKVGVMGFCLGGLMTYLTGARAGFDAGVWYYGGRTEEFLSEAGNLTDPLLMHVGSEDEYISKTAQSAIKEAVKDNSKVEMHIYEGCSHAFARHRGTKFDEDAAKIANARTAEFFKQHLKK